MGPRALSLPARAALQSCSCPHFQQLSTLILHRHESALNWGLTQSLNTIRLTYKCQLFRDPKLEIVCGELLKGVSKIQEGKNRLYGSASLVYRTRNNRRSPAERNRQFLWSNDRQELSPTRDFSSQHQPSSGVNGPTRVIGGGAKDKTLFSGRLRNRVLAKR
jgi:hypothetical protein